MFFIGKMYEIVRDGTEERFPCRFVRSLKFRGDERVYYLFTMGFAQSFIKDYRDGSMYEKSLVIVLPLLQFLAKEKGIPEIDIPAVIFAYSDELAPTESIGSLEPLGWANVLTVS